MSTDMRNLKENNISFAHFIDFIVLQESSPI